MLAIYTRLSKEDETSNSLDNQLREGKEFARIHNFQDVEIYNEGEGISGGAKLEDRPELFRLLQDIRSNKITVAWFRNQNRLERSTATYELFTSQCKESGVRLFFADKEVDFEDVNSFLTGGLSSLINTYNRLLQSAQTKKAIRGNAKIGKSHGINNYGYTTDKKGFIIIEGEEAEIIKDIFKMSLEGKGTDKIAKHLNEQGIPTRYSKDYEGLLKVKYQGKVTYKKKSDAKWSGGNIRRIIRNPIYKGERHLKGEIYEAPSIVSDVYWQKLQDNLENNKRSSGKVVNHKYLLRGVLVCRRCGKNFYGRTKGENDKYSVYICSSKRKGECSSKNIKLKVIDELIWSQFFKQQELSILITKHVQIDDAAPKLKRITEELSNLRKQLKQNKQNIKTTVDMVYTDDFIKKAFESKMKNFETEKSDLEFKIENLQEEHKQVEGFSKKSIDIIADLDKVKNETSFNEKKRIINQYIDSIYVSSAVVRRKSDFFIGIKFNVPQIKQQHYILNGKYQFAISVRDRILIPLSDKFKEYDGVTLKKITESLYDNMAFSSMYNTK